MIRHGGAIYGFSTELALLPEQGLGVVVTSSMDFTNAVVEEIAGRALRGLIRAQNGKLTGAQETSIESLGEAETTSLAGLYQAENPESSPSFLRLVARGRRLFLHAGVQQVELKRDGDSLVTDSRLSIGTPVAGDGEAVELGGRRYIRVPDTFPAEVPSRFQSLIGEYGWDYNTLFILEDHGRLHALIEWFERYPLTELSRLAEADGPRFAFPESGGLYHGEEIHFELDDSGAVVAAVAGGIRFPRREVGTEEGVTFKITPLREIDELRAEALASEPPPALMVGERPPDLVEPSELDDGIRLDVRYATANNFMGAAFYDQPRAFLQRPAAQALVRAHRSLAPHGYGLWIFDAYRPWYVTKMFFDATPAEQKIFVADPASGSRHNRGAAVDLTLYDLATGVPVRTTGGYDEFSNRSFPDYPGGSARQRYLRELLRRSMEAENFDVYEYEWWHFDFRDWESYPVSNDTFEQLELAATAR